MAGPVVISKQWCICMVILLATLAAANTVGGVADSKGAAVPVKVLPLSGTVDPGMAAHVRRALAEDSGSSQTLYVIELDTFGGRVDSALTIVDSLLTLPADRTIAYVKTKAISAGALIALACGRLVMAPNTTIGDCAPITYSSDGPKDLGEKFQSPLRAKFRSLARRNGYPPALAEAMVTKEMAVYQVQGPKQTRYLDAQAYEDLAAEEKKKVVSKKTVVDKGELLTMDNIEALEYGFSKATAASLTEMLELLDVSHFQMKRREETWSEKWVRLIGSITPLLLTIGLAALYTEIKSPGFGIPGAVGVVCLALVFFNQYTVGLADYTELIFIAIGLVLLGFEMFIIPGFGIAGIAGMLSLAIGLILALQDFTIPNPDLPWQGELLVSNATQVIGSFFAAIVVALVLLRYVLPRFSRVVQGPYLEDTLKASHADSLEVGGINAGDQGITLTLMRPAGKVSIAGKRIDAITQGEYYDKDTAVRVLMVDGNRVIVTKDGHHG